MKLYEARDLRQTKGGERNIEGVFRKMPTLRERRK